MTADHPQAPPTGASDVASTTGRYRLPEQFRALAVPSRPAVVAGIGVAVVLVLAYLTGPTLAQFVIGLILVLVLDPIVTWLSRRGLNRGIASVLALVALGIIAFLFATIVVATVLQQVPAFLASVDSFLRGLRDGVEASSLPTEIKEAVAGAFVELQKATD